uniref:Uncharacterized protein n=1 Tax=Anguilla anguilla TaxID=7936 RepID=A0A0E9RLR7_ANGAN
MKLKLFCGIISLGLLIIIVNNASYSGSAGTRTS